MNEDDGVTKADLLTMVAQLSTVAAKALKVAAEATKRAEDTQSSVNYWLGELNKAKARVAELEQQVVNLQSPLADLVRAGKETP